MKKQSVIKKIAASMAALAVAFILMPSMSVHAASEYTVTFRPGNVGQFGIASGEEKTVKEMAQEVADIYYAQYETTITENGAIKVRVPAGADMPAAPGYILPDEGYCVRAWGPEQGEKVTKNVDYVVDYGRLTDGVEYTVKYVDGESGESVAPSMTAYANIGDTVTKSAPASVTTSDAGVYVLTSDATQTITLSGNAASNVITFTYSYSYDAGTVTSEVVRTIPGDTVTATETVTSVADNGTGTVPGAAQAQGGAAGNGDAEDQDGVGIDDENAPLDNGPEGDGTEEELTNIEDERTPLQNLLAGGGSNTIVIMAGAFGVAAIVLALIWLLTRRKKTNAEEEQ